MTNARTQHPNAALTPRQRRKMVRFVLDDGWTIEATADKFQVDAKTVTKWRDRYLAEGYDGLFDRTSRPKSSPNATPPECRRRIIDLRTQRRWGAAHIGHEVGRAGSTVQNILVGEGMGRAWFNQLGIVIERVITDNGSCYRSRLWRTTLENLQITPKFTRPYRPQTNGKVERFHRILLEEWAYIRDWNTDLERSAHYEHFIHFYNHHRAHGALGWSTPMSTLKDNVPGHHT